MTSHFYHPLRTMLKLFAVILATVGTSHAETVTTLDLSSVANARFDSPGFINGSSYPSTGTVTLDGVPYALPATGNYMWHSADAFIGGSSYPHSVDISVGIFGVDRTYTLMGTWWGETLPGSFASIEFIGTGGAYALFELDGGAAIRDYNFNPSYTTALDPAITKEVWANGSGIGTQHIDRQLFDLPAAFDTQTLTTIRLTDYGVDGFQRTFIAAATVVSISPVPEPKTYAMLLVGLGLLGFTARRKK